MTTLIWPTIANALAHAAQVAVPPLTWSPQDHLLSRFAFGSTPAAKSRLASTGPDAWYAAQLKAAAAAPGYSGNGAVAAAGPLLALSITDLRQWLKAHGTEYGWNAMDQLSRVTLGLQAWTGAPLYESLVDFFNDHLHVPNHNANLWVTRHAYDRDVIRANVTGTFTAMLLASARHPAMLQYLDLARSTKAGVNENYGRELLELHTVGRNYLETDVRDCARLLTGRTVDAGYLYTYNAADHYVGPVSVLGHVDANASASTGEAAGDNLLRYLAAHPYTAQHLAQLLCVRYVSDNPSPALVGAVASAYLANRTKILPMISTILRSTEFWQSRGMKVRRPTENVIATLRALGVVPSTMSSALQTLQWVTAGLGNAPLDAPPPSGYSDVAEAWRSSGTLLNLWAVHLGLVAGSYVGLPAPDLTYLYGGSPITSGDALTRLTTRITGTTWSADHLAVLQGFLGEPATTPMARSSLGWLANGVVALILHSPYQAMR